MSSNTEKPKRKSVIRSRRPSGSPRPTCPSIPPRPPRSSWSPLHSGVDRSDGLPPLSVSSASSLRRVSLTCIRKVNIPYSTYTSDNGWIIGGAMLENNRLSLVDYLTYSVKLIDVNSNTVISCIKLPTRPSAITRVKREQIVVLCDNELVFINTGKTLSLVKEVNIIGDCYGIVYTNNKLIVSFLNPGSVKVIDLDGHILKVISTNNKGLNLFEEPCYIALSPEQDTLYVSDEGKHSATSMDLNGTVQCVYKHDRLISPRSLAVDREGNSYIAGQEPCNMHIISPYCRTIRILYKETLGINSPYAIIYCKRDNKLYISHFQGLGNPVNIVSTYQITC